MKRVKRANPAKRDVPGERWYRRVLRLYPRDFRDDFGTEMTRLYRDRRREEPWWSLWSSLVLDLLRTAPSEHLAILKQDLRQTWIGLRRTPVITAAAVLTLALGVGASTAVFSVVYALLLRPLPYPEPEALVELFESNVKAGSLMRGSALNYLTWSERARHFDAIAAFNSIGVTLTDHGDPELLSGSAVTASLFQVLRVNPIVGRTLQPEDEQLASPRVAVIGESLWRSRFGGDDRIVGRLITLDGESHRIAGVIPSAFREVGRAQVSSAGAAQIFLPLRFDRSNEDRANHTLRVVGRLSRGVRLEQARAEMIAMAAAMEREFPATNKDWSVRIERLSDTMFDPQVRRSLLLMLAAVTMVLVIACVNVANLLLVRGTRRQAEFAVRTALGAGRSRLVRQLLTESACLALLSGAAGVLTAIITHPIVRALVPPTLPRVDEMRIDGSVLAFGLVISVVSGFVFGIVPALRASRLDPARSLNQIGRATTDAPRVRLRQTLVVAQIALATMLLVCAGLLVQGFIRLQRVPLGFEPDAVLSVRVSLPRSAYPDAVRAGQFYDRLLASLQGSTQVRAAAIATSAPFAPGVRAGIRPTAGRVISTGVDAGSGSGVGAGSGVGGGRGVSGGGGGSGRGGNRIATADAAEHFVSAGYFRVLGIPLVAGRAFSEGDIVGSPAVAIVSARVAAMLWPNASPLGQTLERNGRSFEVVGVVGDVRGSDTQGARGGGPDREPRAAVYFAATQSPQRTMTVLVQPSGGPSGEPTSIVARFRDAVRELDPTLALQQVRPLREWLTESVAPTRLTTTLAMIFAASALLLTSVGIYGVLAYTVASRTREMGVRMAMGATRGSVIGLVLRQGMTWAAGGILVGLVGAFAAARLLSTLLFDIPARDLMTFTVVGGAVALVALIACSIPAARAIRIDPTIAMRTE
jgi:putative ABC transport system permease protein